MATLEYINYKPSRAQAIGEKVVWTQSNAKPFEKLPQLCWESGETWPEPNLWALELAATQRLKLRTVHGLMDDVLIYAKFLEAEDLDWFHFPKKESERCLVRFRGALIQELENEVFAPRTASECMRTVIGMYRWFMTTGLLSSEWPLWSERQIGIRLINKFGFSHTFKVNGTDLSIPSRKPSGGFNLEDGLLPVTWAEVKEILKLADELAPEEFALMLRLGFQTGLRIDSITDLKVQTILNATKDPVAGWYRLAVGPAARPAVRTKKSVSGMVPIPQELLETLRDYISSARRLLRQAKADRRNRDLLFLTKMGNSYSSESGRAVNVEMYRFRRAARLAGKTVLNGFKFHRSRATFATELMRIALSSKLSKADAVNFVRECCLHKDEKTTLEYVHFIEESKARAQVANAYTRKLLGLANGQRRARAA